MNASIVAAPGRLAAGALLLCLSACGDKVAKPPQPAAPKLDDSWQKLESGLAYKVVKSGAGGPKPAVGDKVWFRYKLQVEGGRVLLPRHRPLATMLVGQWMKGWNEGIQRMSPGDRYQLRIPPELAKNAAGMPIVNIPSDRPLRLDVLLVRSLAMPKFRRLNAKKAILHPKIKGLAYEVLDAGKGDPPSPKDIVVYDVTYWNHTGRMIECTHWTGRPVKGVLARQPLPIVRQGLLLGRPGSKLLLRAPDRLTFRKKGKRPPDMPAGKPSFWLLELQRVIHPLPTPEFVLPSDEQLQATARGLRYQILKPGEGPQWQPGQRLRMHYAGWLHSGKLFESSFAAGEPVTRLPGQLVQGLAEGVRLMRKGAVYRFVVPPALAYGKTGDPPAIGPGATLVYQVELLDLVAGKPPAKRGGKKAGARRGARKPAARENGKKAGVKTPAKPGAKGAGEKK